MFDSIVPEVVGITAIAGAAIGGAFKLAGVVINKVKNGNGVVPVRTSELPCAVHAERIAVLEANCITTKEKLDDVACDVKEILGRIPTRKGP